MAAADSLNMPKESMRNMVPGSLLAVQEDLRVDGVQTWEDVFMRRCTNLLGIMRSVSRF